MKQFLLGSMVLFALSGCGMKPDGKQTLLGDDSAVIIDTAERSPESNADVDSDDVEAEGAPGVMHTGDVNGDGRMDVTASGDGDDGIYVFIQKSDGSFVENRIDSGLTMASDHVMTDLDSDGDMDFIWAVFGPTDILGPDSAVYAYLQD